MNNRVLSGVSDLKRERKCHVTTVKHHTVLTKKKKSYCNPWLIFDTEKIAKPMKKLFKLTWQEYIG